jgi:hypothetical protein
MFPHLALGIEGADDADNGGGCSVGALNGVTWMQSVGFLSQPIR